MKQINRLKFIICLAFMRLNLCKKNISLLEGKIQKKTKIRQFLLPFQIQYVPFLKAITYSLSKCNHRFERKIVQKS